MTHLHPPNQCYYQLTSINFAHLTVSRIQPGQDLKVQVTMATSKVKSRSHHDVAQLQPPNNVCTKSQLPTPYGLSEIAQMPWVKIITRLGQLGANISPDRSSLTPQVLIGNFLKHNYPLLYELQHINLLCLYLPKEDGVSPDAEYITQIIFSIFLQ